jgi:hypothetical protein
MEASCRVWETASTGISPEHPERIPLNELVLATRQEYRIRSSPQTITQDHYECRYDQDKTLYFLLLLLHKTTWALLHPAALHQA